MEFPKNLSLRQDATANCSVRPTIGDGLQDINYILNCDEPWESGFWCDTYDGLNQSAEDWWGVNWSVPVYCNTLQFRQGPMTDSGGWWCDLHLEYQNVGDKTWKPVVNMNIVPHYDFANHRLNRMPYERFTIIFNRVQCVGIRLIGKPGGIAQHTKIAQLSVFDHDLRYWVPPPAEPPPKPRILRLLPPEDVFHLLARFFPVCDILFTLVIGRLNLIYFLGEQDYLAWKELSRFSADPRDFWRKVYEKEGARRWYDLSQQLIDQAFKERRAVTGVRADGLAQIVAPLILDGKILGVLRNTSLVRVENGNESGQSRYIRELNLDEKRYIKELKKIPCVSLQKLEAIGLFVDTIAKTLIELYLRNQIIGEIKRGQIILRSSNDRRLVVQKAIHYMREHLGDPITVEELAKQLAMSQGHFSRIFKAETGRCPQQYLMDLRLERACYLLRNGMVSVAEACGAVGYQSIPSFTRLFKNRLGVTPGEYAREKN